MTDHDAIQDLFDALRKASLAWMKKHKQLGGRVFLLAAANYLAWAVVVSCKKAEDRKRTLGKASEASALALDAFSGGRVQ
jgi:hypothetical protein